MLIPTEQYYCTVTVILCVFLAVIICGVHLWVYEAAYYFIFIRYSVQEKVVHF